MKTILFLVLAYIPFNSFAGIKCVGKTVESFNDGSTESVRTKLRKAIDDRAHAVYYGESHLFRFWVLHELKENLVTLEIMNIRDSLVVHAPKMQVPRFSVSAGGYWQEDFASLECSPAIDLD